ncbi:metal ABC transporter ATP-binding protein [Maribellus luteus]|uniref:Metal ABC transporter ATP-binding protein n=1 Tax=Maribellus luteus TaxID=2305463 RepID=A0A399T1F4_9BACT|nr:metal ABC transporter ATP-binding protein [Maribellus luteus]RIJ48859.1 metal ABC transporter ATP-binding protein [Maribellus luteus]
MKPLVKIENLTCAYDKIPVLENVNLEVNERDFLGVIGPNGGGKTTLLKAILGLLKPVKGKIVFGSDLQGRKKPIGYLPQVRHIDKKFPITVFDVVLSGSIMNGIYRPSAEERQKAEQLLVEMGILDIRHKAIGELSGGQMQRVFLCRALLSDPKLLILDEPDTFVDNRFEGELYEKLRALNKEIAIILVSHDVGTISTYVKTIACVNKSLHYHPSNIITQEQLEGYNCPIQVITHGEVPHTVLQYHHH